MPLLSVVTVVLNDLPGVTRTARSLASQQWRDFEWIVIDGGSTDGTHDFLAEAEPRPAFMASESDRGTYDAMNKGLARASGDLVVYLNSGDRLTHPRVLASAVRRLGGAEVTWGYGAQRYLVRGISLGAVKG